jgi:hypothetical protein
MGLTPTSRLGFLADLSTDSWTGLVCVSDSPEYAWAVFRGAGEDWSLRDGSTGGKGRFGFGEK